MVNIEAIIRSDAVCALIFALLGCILYVETRFELKKDKWIGIALLMALLSTVVCIVSWILDTQALLTPVAQTIGRWVQFASYMMSPFMIIAFLVYAWLQINEHAKLKRRWVSVPLLVVLLVEAGLAYGTATGSTVLYDAAGKPVICHLDRVAYCLDIALIVYAVGFLIVLRREVGRREAMVMTFIYIVSLFGLAAECLIPKLSDIGFVGMALSMVAAVIYIPIKRSIQAKESEAAKSMFVASVSHDIRTPLNAILGFAAVLRDKDVPETERKQALEAITASGNLLMGLVNDVLDFSKIEHGKMTINPSSTDVAALAEEVVLVFRGSTSGSAVRVTCAHDIWTHLEVDSRRLRQILFNLLGNTVKFTTEGEIALRATYLPAQNGLGTLIMSVSDTGIGIPAERQGELMQPYVQLHQRGPNGGTGLGLFICRRLAEAMGGTLTLASEYGKGTTFTLTIYGVRAVAAPEKAPAAKAEIKLPKGRSRILLVDDTELNLKVTETLLKRLGCADVVRAHNGVEALDLLRRDPQIGIVFTDMWMPEMDGAALATAIRAEAALEGIAVYAVTGDADTLADRTVFDGILLKPITVDNLRAVLASN